MDVVLDLPRVDEQMLALQIPSLPGAVFVELAPSGFTWMATVEH